MSGLTHDDLCACLAAAAPVELLGMTLLRQGSPQLLPSNVPRDVLREAVAEIIAYTGRCVAAANRLSNLAPVPLFHVVIVEFGL
ncbi:MAG TPA: hypothetical protein PKD09_04975 [Aggregatilinea sp.]|uniref:hypothetical protein n=1 Tax=Aggregatilinea sp. TaxID=2806333 RepID=UPI002C72B0B2|nr:hypothetical protein [Aggregatilinea sp.]HML20978.1 hypothetical protein [Aggregatilinea sp.]